MNELVGTKFELIKTMRTIAGQEWPEYSLYPADEKRIKELGAGHRVRIWLPGTVGTMDFNTSRINVKINSQGIVTEVYNG